MSKLNRVFQKIFGDSGSVSNFGQFGSLAAGTPTTTKDPSTIQSLAAWLSGWQSATVGSLRPAYQDMNSAFYLAFYQICYLFQMGIAEWDSSTEYETSSVVLYNGSIYQSILDTNIGNTPSSSPSYWQAGLPSAEAPGVVKDFAGAIAPAGYFICNGTAVSRSTYANLFAVIGTTYGIGDGSTTFNIPDTRGYTSVGLKTGDADFGSLGQVSGAKTVTLDVSMMPSHTHDVQLTNGTGSGIKRVDWVVGGNGDIVPGAALSTGGGAAHGNIQPSIVFNKIIKF